MNAITTHSSTGSRSSGEKWHRMFWGCALVASLGGSRPLLAAPPADGNHEEIDVSAGEDLMREHGVLRRALLIYEAALARPAPDDKIARTTIAQTAGLIRKFVENYHEKTEEQFIFPRFAGSELAGLVETLKAQHQYGRTLTHTILLLAGAEHLTASQKDSLSTCVRNFIAMYRAHAAREDTILFPAFHALVGKAEYERLGDQFEQREHALLGDKGFEHAVDRIADLEKKMGIYDLNRLILPLPKGD